MKLRTCFLLRTTFESHPAGVRGLKLSLAGALSSVGIVAPRRGAWIETALSME